MLTLAMSISVLGVTASNSVFADSHLPSQSGPSALVYESALTGYKTLDGDERKTWKESNEIVGEIGGWRTYANEAYEANQAAEARAESESGDLAEGASETVTSAVATPVADTDAKRLNSAAVTEDDDMAATDKDSQRMSGAHAGSEPVVITYQSAMTEHRFYDDNPPGDWKAANDRVGEIGGWRTYAQRAYEASKLEAQANTKSENSQ